MLVLVDLRNTTMTQTAQKLLTERITDTRRYVLRTAVVSMMGIRRIFLDLFSRPAGFCLSLFPFSSGAIV
jgi:hypothetical protein